MIVPYHLARIVLAALGTAGLLVGEPRLVADEPSAPNQESFNAQPAMRAEIQRHVEQIDLADSALQTEQSYQALVDAASPEELAALRAAGHDGIGLQLTWKGVRERRFDGDGPPASGRNGARLNQAAVNQFVGYVEGRLRVSVPSWWKRTVVQARAHADDQLRFPVEKHFAYHATGRDLWAPPGTWIDEGGDDVTLSVDRESLAIPAGILDEQQYLEPSITAHFTPQVCYAALHGSSGGDDTFNVHCFRRGSRERAWTARVSGNHKFIVHGGVYREGDRPGDHAVALVTSGDRLFVFGADYSSVYIHGFDATNGENLFRFCTAYEER